MKKAKKPNKRAIEKQKRNVDIRGGLLASLPGDPSLPGDVSAQEQNKPGPSMPPKLPLSKHPIARHVDRIRELVHGALADAGISGLSLRAMHFDVSDSCSDPCPPGQHRKMVCRTMPDGSQVCSCECVPI